LLICAASENLRTKYDELQKEIEQLRERKHYPLKKSGILIKSKLIYVAIALANCMLA